MTDIIAKAQWLLEGVTPGDWVAIPHDDWDNAKVISPDDEPGVCEIATMFQEEHDLADAKLMAASKTHAQALAEETYEYAAQAKTGSKWEYMQDGFYRDAWLSDLQKAKAGARELRSIGKKTRIVRRRVSPVEVIND